MPVNPNALKPAAVALPRPSRLLYLALVYQAGIANVIQLSALLPQPARDLPPSPLVARMRVYQGDFRTAESICYGAALAGARVRTYHCNEAGDIRDRPWSADLDAAPFSDRFNPQTWN